jgi:uncharacterized membrane protein YbhN (UPF0104 family)
MPEVTPVKKNPVSRLIKLLLKIAVTVACFWYISRKIDFARAGEAIGKADWWWLLASALLLTISKLLSSLRLNIYFRNIGLVLSEKKNLKLYWLGMFYNLFLPGAIGGDAYKVILLKKKFNGSYKKITAAVLLDRFSGLLAIGVILAAYGIIVLNNAMYAAVLGAGAVLSVVVLYLIVKRYFNDFVSGFWPTFYWGLAVQVTQVFCVYAILLGLHVPIQQSEWIFIFLAAAVITVIPVSLGGGLGTRELVFVEGARYFGLDMHIAPVISILFYLSSAVSAIWGVYFIYHDPLANTSDDR